MKKTISLFIAAIIVVVAFTCTNPKEEQFKEEQKVEKNKTVVWPGYQPIPNGFDYPANTTTLNAAVANADIPSIRSHAWSLFAGMMQPASGNVNWPVWYTWPNSVDAMRIKDKFCQWDTGHAPKQVGDALSLIQQNKLHKASSGVILDTLQTPYYPIPKPVIDMFKNSNVFRQNYSIIIPGKHFLFNGDIMVPTESLSSDAFNWINNNRFYNKTVMDSLYKINKGKNLDAPPSYIVTKHMYWPVLKGQLNLVPVWKASSFAPDYAGYAGYEKWKHFVAVDPGHITNNVIPSKLSYLYNVYNFDTTKLIGPVTVNRPKVYSINDFYYHEITQADWDSFDASDKAILMASSYWAYNKPIGVGDYLVTIASHINTKEIYSWTMQSAWWSDAPAEGPYSKNRPNLPNAKGPWRHYELVDAYGVPVNNANELPMASNPYIELVIHPMQTNCNNCHMRAGYPTASSSFSNGATYQNPTCKDLLMKLTERTPCLQYYMRTDFQWIIPDYTHNNLCDQKAR